MLQITVIEEHYPSNIYDLKYLLWSGAVDTIEKIIEENKEDNFLEFINEIYQEPIELTELNDFIWFERDYIYKVLEIEEE